MQASRRRGRIVTFYSYKGGTGRSMALANIAWILACNGKRVLTIDWDLEAPGLHRYFRPFLLDPELSSSEGLIDLIDRYATAAISPVHAGHEPSPDWYLEYADFEDHVLGLDFEHFPPGGKIDLLPAGRQTDTYAVKVSSFNWQNFYDRLGGGAFFEAVKERARRDYDYVLIDSRTGVSDTAGICTAQMPDSLVVCFTYNNQSIKGAAAVARSALATHARIADERASRAGAASGEAASDGSLEDTPRPYVVYPVPMRVDAGESDRLALRQAFARESFADLVAHIAPSEVAEYWSGVEVPHRVFYAYEEVLAPFKDDAHDPKTVLAAFLRLTARMTEGDVTDYHLPIAPEVRQHFLEAFAETPLTVQAKRARQEAERETAEQALVRNADAAIYALEEEDKGEAQQVLCRLVRLGRDEEGGSYFPIRASLADFDAAQRAVIAQLARRGVVAVNSDVRYTSTQMTSPSTLSTLTASPTTTVPLEQSVSLADGRLVALWPTLIRWLEADREFLIWRQQLRTYLADWERSGRDMGAFLSGTLLGEAQLWLHRRPADLGASERAYIEASAANARRLEAINAPPPQMPSAPLAMAASLRGTGRGVAGDEPPELRPARRPGVAVALLLAALVVLAVFGLWSLGKGFISPQRPPGYGGMPAVMPSASVALPADAAAALRLKLDAQTAIGREALARDDFAAAAAAFTAALGLDPGSYDAALLLAQAHAGQNDADGAAKAYQQAMTIAPSRPDAWLDRAALEALQGRFAEAIADYSHAIELGSDDGLAYFNRGAANESAKNIGAAVADYTAALRIKPDLVPALLARARLTGKSNAGAARADYEAVLKLPAGNAEQRQARDALKAIGGEAAAATVQRVVLQYRDSGDDDKTQAEAFRRELAADLKPIDVTTPDAVGVPSDGTVRYFFAGDKEFAAGVLAAARAVLARQGSRASLEMRYLDAKNLPRARAGSVEIWLPSLTATQPLPRETYKK